MSQKDVLSEQTQRERQIAMLLRQLSVGLSAYRLFPGNTEQEAFVAAVARITDAAQDALGRGSITVDIRGRTFATADGPLPKDETTDRLAVACYERRVERLRLRAAPSADELATMYEALTRDVEEVAAAGGVQAILGHAGVTSISLTEIEPQPIDAAVALSSLTPEQAEMWELLQEGRPLIPVDDLETGSPDAASRVYGRFRDLFEALPPEVAGDPELYRRVHRAVTTLPKEVRRDLIGVLIDDSQSEPVAARIVSSITDHQLGEYLVELGEDGERDPVELARELVARGSRQKGLVDLVRGLIPASTTPRTRSDDAPVGLEPSEPDHHRTVGAAVSDMVAGGLAGGHDAAAIRLEFPHAPDDLRTQALATLRDYLAVEEDLERLEGVMDLWVKEVRGALLDGDGQTSSLVEATRSARERTRGNGERAAIFTEFERRILDRPFLEELLGPETQTDTQRLLALLDPLEETAVESLMDALAEESDRARRATLVSILAGMAGRYPEPVVARLDDDRWYVVRNAVNILHKARVGRKLVPLLEKVANHGHSAVRREVIWGLVSALGSEAAPHMRRFVVDQDATVRERAVSFLGGLDSSQAIEVLADVARTAGDPNLRRRALDEISQSPSPGAAQLLRRLASFRNRPRLPRSLRRHAKRLIRQRRRSK